MVRKPYQIPSKTCGCVDCVADYPPAQYGERPHRDGCLGKWQVRYRGEGGRQRSRNFETLSDATLFVASLGVKEASGGA